MSEHDTERAAFEAWITAPPIEAAITRLGDASSWPGQYRDYRTQLACEAWQAALDWARQGDEPTSR